MDALPEFELLRAATLDDVVKARAKYPDSRLLGGGTDLVVNIRRGIVAPPVLIDVNHVKELRAIKADARQQSSQRSWIRAGCFARMPIAGAAPLLQRGE